MRPLKCRHSNMEVVFGSTNLFLLLVITLVGTFTNYTGLWSSNRDVVWLPPLPGSIYGFRLGNPVSYSMTVSFLVLLVYKSTLLYFGLFKPDTF